MGLPQPLIPLCSVPQRLADAAENFQKAHRWQDNIKVRSAVPSPAPVTCPQPARVDVDSGEGALPRLTGGALRALWRGAWDRSIASSKRLRLPLMLGHRVQRGTSHYTLEELWGPPGGRQTTLN